MRVLDMHTHLPGRSFGATRRPTTDVLAMMDQAGIDQAVVLTIDGFFYDVVAGNNALAEQSAESGGRFIPFCTVDPRQDSAAAEVHRCIRDLGFRGVKIHPWWQGVSPLDPCMLPVAAAADELGVPMLFHDGTPPFSTPLQVAYLCHRFPTLDIILGHGGGMDLWGEAIAALNRYPNCYVCLSGSTPPAIFKAVIQSVAPHKVTIGTDAGFGDDYQAEFRMEIFRDLLADFPEDQQAAYFWRNGARLLEMA